MSIAPDGSPVALYLALPGEEEAQLIHRAIPAQADVLELGCGAGRVTEPLAALGHIITAVDNSREMLAVFPSLTGADTVLADIVSLDLGRRFAAVVLASFMINGEDGIEYLRTAARHVASDGLVLVQRHEPGWVDRAEPEVSEHDDVRFELTDVEHPAPGVVRATIVYTLAGVTYRQVFTAHETDDEHLAHMAQQVGLRVAACADGDPSWVKLTPQNS